MELIHGKRQRKCTRCTNKVDIFYKYKNKSICTECIETYLDLKVTCSICNTKIKRRYEYIPQNDSKTAKVFCSEACFNSFSKDKLDLEELDSFLKEYHGVEALNPRIFVQINEFKKKYNFTTRGILLTLKYMSTTLKKELAVDNITQVQYYYDKAKQEYVTKLNREVVAAKLQKENYKMISGVKKVKINYTRSKKDILITELDLEE